MTDEELAELDALAESADDETLEEAPPAPERSRVVVDLSAHDHADEQTDAVIAALASTKELYRRGGKVSAVRGWVRQDNSTVTATGSDEIARPTFAVTEGSPVIRVIRHGALDYAVSRLVECQAMRRPPGRPRKGEDSAARLTTVPCPSRVLGQIDGVAGDGEGRRPLPSLEGILRVPSLRPDGSVIEAPGYDPLTGYYLASGVRLTHLREKPTKDSAVAALKALQDLFAPTIGEKMGFPWKRGLAETIVPVALALTVIARPALGCVPCFLVDASTPGSGKGLVVGVASMIATGEEPARAGWPINPEEQEKAIGAFALMSPPIIAWDNVRGLISSTHLENALTTPVYAFRVLGFSEMMPLAFRPVVTFTGNNVGLSGDMPRRTYVCRLEPATEKPQSIPGEKFRHPRIIEHTARFRGKYVSACLTVLRAFHLADRPSQGLKYSSYESWHELIGNALAWCGAGDITEFSGVEAAEEPPEWSAMRTLTAGWRRIDAEGKGITLSSLLATLYNSEVQDAIRRGKPIDEVEQLRWGDMRAAVQLLAKCPDRAIPDATKLGNGLKVLQSRWFTSGEGSAFASRRIVNVVGPTGKPSVPARWKVEEQ